MLIRLSTAGLIAEQFAGQGVERWESIWMFSSLFDFFVTIIFSVLFKDRITRVSDNKVL
jgi:hypothetical protein